LNRFDRIEETFTHFTRKEGMPDNVVYGILSDRKHNLWLSTNKGLSRFNTSLKTFRNFDVTDGLQSNEFNTLASFKSESGEMFFGGIKGITYFYPEEVVDNPHIPEVKITGLRIFNEEVTPDNRPDLLSTVISQTTELNLTFRENIITFEFASLDFSAPERNRYAYKLDGFNEEWIYAGASRSATFTNLPPGEYVFRVKGSNNDGVWNEVGAALKLHVNPPPWRTWWAYLLYGTLLLGILYGIRRYEVNRLRLKSRLKMEQVDKEKLTELDQMKTQFFANISHEFRTPLTLILGQVDRVLSDSTDSHERKRLEVALRNARRLLKLINQLLDLSRLEAGSMPLKGQHQNIIPFLKNVFFSFESLAEEKQIRLVFQTSHEHINVFFEPDKMEKVFNNLFSNAVKFTEAGGKISIEVLIRNTQHEIRENRLVRGSDPISVEILVRDTGCGIPAEQLPHVFDRFFQVEDSSRREQDGSGIGLALVKELIELHGGSVSVSSVEGESTTFSVRLPVVSAANAENVNGPTHPSIAQNALSHVAPDEMDKKEIECETDQPVASLKSAFMILIVEDHPDIRVYIREQLASHYQLLEAVNGKEGYRLACENIPDLIITDIMMPEMDGYQMSSLIKKDTRTCHIPIIMLTAKAGIEDKIEGLETGADDYLLKPFSAKELRVRVHNLINTRQKLRERFREVTVVKPAEVTAIPIEQAFLEKVIAVTEENLGDENFNVPELAKLVGMSVSQLNRKL
ncbi:MAG: response regulator, partial [Methanobacteriota archaeon]